MEPSPLQLYPSGPEPEAAARPKPEPSQPAQAPTPSTLVRELTEKPTAAPEKPPSPTREAKAEPTPPPSPQLPAESKVQPAAPPAPLPPATAAAEPELPPQPAKSLTQDPAAETQTAALPPSGTLAGQVRVLFPEDSATLSDDGKSRLAGAAAFLKANPSARVQLLSYAKGSLDNTSRARRLSLSRALAVRAFLIEQGVRSTRMDVRALGDKAPDGPVDRVDVMPQAAGQ